MSLRYKMHSHALKQRLITLTFVVLLSACGFHLQGAMQLPKPLQHLYLQTSDPYGFLTRLLKQNLKMSNVTLVNSPSEAKTVLVILHDIESQSLLSVSSTQQTRQYNLTVSVTFSITDSLGRTLVPPQTLSESRAITTQSNQVLGSSNEVTLLYQQMRRALASAIMNSLASTNVANLVTKVQP